MGAAGVNGSTGIRSATMSRIAAKLPKAARPQHQRNRGTGLVLPNRPNIIARKNGTNGRTPTKTEKSKSFTRSIQSGKRRLPAGHRLRRRVRNFNPSRPTTRDRSLCSGTLPRGPRRPSAPAPVRHSSGSGKWTQHFHTTDISGSWLAIELALAILCSWVSLDHCSDRREEVEGR